MKTRKTVLAILLTGMMHMAMAGEIGIGHDDPVVEPTEPSTSGTVGGGFLEQLTEWFELDSNDK